MFLFPDNHRRSGTNIEGSLAGIPAMSARDHETTLHLEIRSIDQPTMLIIPIGDA